MDWQEKTRAKYAAARQHREEDAVDKGDLRSKLVDWLDEKFETVLPRRGEVRDAVILDMGENDIVVDLGANRDGIVPPQDLDLLDEEVLSGLQVGDHVPVVVLSAWRPNEGLLVSINKGLQREDWLRAEKLVDTQKVIEVEVVDVNRGGVLVSLGRLQGFVPNSLISSTPRGLRGEKLAAAKRELVGKTLSVVVIEVNQRRRRLVLSERQAGRVQRQRLLQDLNEGEVIKGVVSSIVDFGAFVDLGGMDGLVHVSELAWTHVDHPADVLDVGDEIEVYVLKVDRDRERISLSRKRLLPDPWFEVAEKLLPGQIVEGTVTSVVDFGAFVDLGQSVEGLVHISEMPAGQGSPAQLESGDPVAVRVLEVEDERRRISLSMRGISSTMSAAMTAAVHEGMAEPS
jgi:small subunit ribosomal protein S1